MVNQLKSLIVAGLLLFGAASANAGNVYTKMLSASLTCDTSAYASGDLVGGLMTFSGVQRGMIVSVELTDLNAQAIDFDIVFFCSNPSATTFTDQVALDVADADVPKICGAVHLDSTTRYAFADNSVHYLPGQAVPFVSEYTASSSTYKFYAVLIPRGAATFASAADATVKLGISQDQ